MDKEEQILRKRFSDLANSADRREAVLYSDFLNLNEQNIFHHSKTELPRIKYFAYGGYVDAERKILCFYGKEDSVEESDLEYPITCIKVEPINQKFSDDLNHRDFLGAVINLGLDRTKIGDILILENEGYLMVHNNIAEYIMDSLFKVKHTNVSCTIVDYKHLQYQPKTKEINGTVSSMRLDAVLAVAFKSSRSSLTGLIEGGKVSVDGKIILSNSYNLKEHDVVSVRGFGKFKFMGSSYQTKKGRYSVKVLLYV